MSRKNLTSKKRSFGDNPDSFAINSENEPIVLTIDNDNPLETTKVVVVNPKSLDVTGPNGENLGGSVKVTRRSQYVEREELL